MAEDGPQMDDQEARERVGRIEAMLEDIESLPDPVAQARCTEVVSALLDLYGEGLARIVGRTPEPQALVEDELVAHLLLLHGLHPVPVEARVHGALEEVRPYLQSHGGNVQLISLQERVLRLRLEGSCSGCPSSAATLSLAVEEAIHKAAPEIEEIQAEDAEPAPAPANGPALIQLEPLTAPTPNGNGASRWATAGVLPQLRTGGTLLKEVSGEAVLFCEVDGTPYAYRPGCPECGESLETGALRGAELECAGCGHRFDVRLAGRCTDAPDLHLEPVPLLIDDAGLVKVALSPAA
jgi:Fe-S cluster biogenesis protein NfuA/nitrite reductase/ring-hydroxylating ferredoxin subunit